MKGYLFQTRFGLRLDQMNEIRWAELPKDWERFCSRDDRLVDIGFDDSVMLGRCQKRDAVVGGGGGGGGRATDSGTAGTTIVAGPF